MTVGLSGIFVKGGVRLRVLYRNKIVSNTVPSAVHANPSVTQKTRIVK